MGGYAALQLRDSAAGKRKLREAHAALAGRRGASVVDHVLPAEDSVANPNLINTCNIRIAASTVVRSGPNSLEAQRGTAPGLQVVSSLTSDFRG